MACTTLKITPVHLQLCPPHNGRQDTGDTLTVPSTLLVQKARKGNGTRRGNGIGTMLEKVGNCRRPTHKKD